MNTFNTNIIHGKNQEFSGDVCIPDRGDKVTKNSIIIIPHGGANYHIAGMQCKAIVTEIGNRLCHLAIITREFGKVIILMPNAIKELEHTKRILIKCSEFGEESLIIKLKNKTNLK